MKEFINKLIARLEERRNEENNNALCEMNENGHTLDFECSVGKTNAFNESISIVNQLAEECNNDYCVWKKYKDKHVHYENCRWRNEDIDEFTVNHFSYCPYCGKKIKVVGR